ncbi:hypothetical protein KGM_210597 [Danaus plexippus plexippus]|uniref:Phospholipid scramblase n=1 Tax=Danaus plexippus plexippus TaxID=278856 RepID=A0A212ERV1_DANPL|nr:hypothetical protein KGM_210597 [Danaus plexippus plexippus]
MEVLKALDRLVIRERSDSSSSRYVVLTSEGVPVMQARENTGLLHQVLAGRSRAFHIDIYDMEQHEVIKLRRPYSVSSDKMDVCVCGETVAVVRKEVTFLKPVLVINDSSDRNVIRVKGPVSITDDCHFELFTADKKTLGDISRRCRRVGAERDLFTINFPLQLDPRYKAAVIGTCFLILKYSVTGDEGTFGRKTKINANFN